MNALEFRAIRQSLGLSARGMASLLQLGVWGDRTVRRWEAADNDIPGPVVVLLHVLLKSAQARAVIGVSLMRR